MPLDSIYSMQNIFSNFYVSHFILLTRVQYWANSNCNDENIIRYKKLIDVIHYMGIWNKQELHKGSVSKIHIYYKQFQKEKHADFCMVILSTYTQPLLIKAIDYGDRRD